MLLIVSLTEDFSSSTHARFAENPQARQRGMKTDHRLRRAYSLLRSDGDEEGSDINSFEVDAGNWDFGT